MIYRNSWLEKKTLAARAWIRREREETSVLLRCIPATVVSLFVVSVVSMNLLAKYLKSLHFKVIPHKKLNTVSAIDAGRKSLQCHPPCSRCR